MRDTRRLSLIKSISWRFFAVVISFIIAYIITGSLKISTSVSILDSFVKVFMYYAHERLWQKNFLARFFREAPSS